MSFILSNTLVFTTLAAAGLATHISSDFRIPDANAALGKHNDLMTIATGASYWLSGLGTHNIYGDVANEGTITLSQTDWKATVPGGQTCNWIGGTLSNKGSFILNDASALSAPTYNWLLDSVNNKGTIQWCGRGDTGGSTYLLSSKQDLINDGLIVFEQVRGNWGTAVTLKNTISTSSALQAKSNVYNNGGILIRKTRLDLTQNILGSGCWMIDADAVLYLQDGLSAFNNFGFKSSLEGQSVSFVGASGTLHMDAAVYSRNKKFGAKVFNFGLGHSIEFTETIKSVSYNAVSGFLAVSFVSKASVDIEIGTGYDATKFSFSAKASFYAAFNAVFYAGKAPSQSAPLKCLLTANVCQPINGQVQGSATASVGQPGYVPISAPASLALPTIPARPTAYIPSLPGINLPAVSIPPVTQPAFGLPGLARPTIVLPDLSAPSLPLPSNVLSVVNQTLLVPSIGIPVNLPSVASIGLPGVDVPGIPYPSVTVPTIQLPQISAAVPGVALSGVGLPQVSIAKPSIALPSFGLPQVSVAKPTIDIPKVSLAVPSVALPSVIFPQVSIALPSLIVPTITKASLAVPSIGLSSVGLLPAGLPSVSAPSIRGPSVGQPSVSLPKASVGSPSIKLPSINSPSAGLPAAGLPSVASPSTGMPANTLSSLISVGLPKISTVLPSATTPAVSIPTVGVSGISTVLPSLTVSSFSFTSAGLPSVGLPSAGLSSVPVISPSVVTPSFTVSTISLAIPSITSTITVATSISTATLPPVSVLTGFTVATLSGVPGSIPAATASLISNASGPASLSAITPSPVLPSGQASGSLSLTMPLSPSVSVPAVTSGAPSVTTVQPTVSLSNTATSSSQEDSQPSATGYYPGVSGSTTSASAEAAPLVTIPGYETTASGATPTTFITRTTSTRSVTPDVSQTGSPATYDADNSGYESYDDDQDNSSYDDAEYSY